MTPIDLKIFRDINNAVLDLQASTYQTYPRPLKLLGRLFSTPELEEINRPLREKVDFDAFIAAGDGSGGSMVGSDRLSWPDDKEEEFGLTLILIDRMAADPNWATDFCFQFYYSGNDIVSGIHSFAGQELARFVRDYRAYIEEKQTGQAHPVVPSKILPVQSSKIFIVHGHDEAARETVARFLERAGFEPVILHEQANRGMTIPEKLDAYGDVGFAVVLLTPDDEGRQVGKTDFSQRARQNVMLELGYFVGRLGRDRVCALRRGSVEIPSDYVGVVYTDYDDAGAWKPKLGMELKAAGYTVDWQRLMGH